MTDIRPIETQYAGCRFRSRLEARWAVFFDHLGVEWQYEVEGYTLSTGDRYLPDFYLPQLDQWVEVKGKMSRRDFLRVAVAATELPVSLRPKQIRPGVLVLGPIPEPGPPILHCRMAALDGNALWQQVFFTPNQDLQPILSMVVFRLPALMKQPEESMGKFLAALTDATSETYLAPIPEVSDAYRAARSARFEHGESGAPARQATKPRKVRANPGPGYLRGTLVRLEGTYDLTTVDGRVSALREMAPVIAACEDDALRTEWIGIAAARLGLSDQADAVARAVAHHRTN